MSVVSAEEVRAFVLRRLQKHLPKTADLPDDFDLLDSGVVDSLAMVDLIVAVERQFGVEIDFAELNPQVLTIIGPLCQYIADRSDTSAVTQMPPPVAPTEHDGV